MGPLTINLDSPERPLMQAAIQTLNVVKACLDDDTLTAFPQAARLHLEAVLAAWELRFIEAAREARKPLDDPRLKQLFGDCIQGALTMGYQGIKPRPEGHWLWRFWSMAHAVALKESQSAPEQPDRLAAAAIVAMLFSEHEEALPEDLLEQARTAFTQSGLDIDDDSQEAAMEVRVLALLRGLLAQPAATPAAR